MLHSRQTRRQVVAVAGAAGLALARGAPAAAEDAAVEVTPVERESVEVTPAPAAPALIRIPRPEVPAGPRRIGLQAGHWLTDQVPEELRRLEVQTGTSWAGVDEWRVNLDVANRAASILRDHGFQVDVLPTVVPAGYLAHAFVALHADGDRDGSARGFKAAHGSRRGPHEGSLVELLVDEYARATGLPQDHRITRNMLGYYAFSWSRFASAVAPHTPAAILEMGFLSNAADRALLVGRPGVAAAGVANGILRFVHEAPDPFEHDLLVPPRPARPPGARPPDSRG